MLTPRAALRHRRPGADDVGSIAVTIAIRRRGQNWIPYLLIALIFIYTTIQNIHERPEGIKIASFFILAIILSSFISRVWRTTELRVERVEVDDLAREFLKRAATGTVRIIANRRDTGDALEYQQKETRSGLIITFLPVNPCCFLK